MYQVINEGLRPDISQFGKEYFKIVKIMEECWAENPKQRPKAFELIEKFKLL